MAESDPAKALAKSKSDDMTLMPPPRLPKRIKRPAKVLDEDVYTDALSHIIARDFFPGLLETQAQQEYMDALDSNNDDWIREAGNNLKEAMTPDPYRARRQKPGSMGVRGSDTPASVATTATPGRTPLSRYQTRDPSATPISEAKPQPPLAEVDLSLSLTEFQSKYTSEDNESFNGVLDAQNLAKAKKYAFLRNHTNKLPSKQQLAQQKLLTSDGESPPVTSSPAVTSTTIAKTRTDSASFSTLVPRPSQDLAARPASVESFPVRQGARNTFMFYPDPDDDVASASGVTAAAKSLAPPRAINFAATRLPGPEAEQHRVPPSPSMSAVDAAIAGRPRLSASEMGSNAGEGYSGSETPRVNGWKFVDAEPTAAEERLHKSSRGTAVGDDEEARRQEREEVMKLLPRLDSSDGGDSSGSGFRMNERSSKEELLDRMVEKNQRAKRKSRPDERVHGDLTPAGRSLASRLGTPGRTPGAGLFGGESSRSSGTGKARTPMRTPGVKR